MGLVKISDAAVVFGLVLDSVASRPTASQSPTGFSLTCLVMWVTSDSLEGQRASMCALHRTPEMVDVVSKRCHEPNCRTQPSYGKSGGFAEYCAKHKKDDMVNVVSKRCETDGCDKIPVYGVTGRKATHCGLHKKENMVNGGPPAMRGARVPDATLLRLRGWQGYVLQV